MSGSAVITSALKNTLINLQKVRGDQASPSGNNAASQQAGAVQDSVELSIDPSSLSSKAEELNAKLAKIDENIGILSKSLETRGEIEGKVRGADRIIGEAIQKLARDAGTGVKTDPEVLEGFKARFLEAIDGIDALVAQRDDADVNLLRGQALETNFTGFQNSGYITQGSDLTVEGLGLQEISFEKLNDIVGLSDSLRSSLEGIRGLATAVEIDLREIQTKQDFATGTVEALQAGAQGLDNLGQTEEGANLLAQQASTLLAGSEDPLIKEAQEELLNLF